MRACMCVCPCAREVAAIRSAYGLATARQPAATSNFRLELSFPSGQVGRKKLHASAKKLQKVLADSRKIPTFVASN